MWCLDYCGPSVVHCEECGRHVAKVFKKHRLCWWCQFLFNIDDFQTPHCQCDYCIATAIKEGNELISELGPLGPLQEDELKLVIMTGRMKSELLAVRNMKAQRQRANSRGRPSLAIADVSARVASAEPAGAWGPRASAPGSDSPGASAPGHPCAKTWLAGSANAASSGAASSSGSAGPAGSGSGRGAKTVTVRASSTTARRGSLPRAASPCAKPRQGTAEASAASVQKVSARLRDGLARVDKDVAEEAGSAPTSPDSYLALKVAGMSNKFDRLVTTFEQIWEQQSEQALQEEMNRKFFESNVLAALRTLQTGVSELKDEVQAGAAATLALNARLQRVEDLLEDLRPGSRQEEDENESEDETEGESGLFPDDEGFSAAGQKESSAEEAVGA